METLSPPYPALDLSPNLYRQLVYTLTGLLPPPIDDTPQALHARNHAAIAKVAALLPVNANEADLAAQCIAARAQAEDMLRLLRQHAGDIGLVMRLNAQYGSMVRTSLSVHARLMRVQALRQKREAIGDTANADAWAQDVAKRSMLRVMYPDAGPLRAVPPEGARAEPPEGARAVPPAPSVDQRTEDLVPENGTDSQDAAFETWLSEQPWNQVPRGTSETDLREFVSELLARSRSAGRELPADGHESSKGADHYCLIDGETAST